MGITSTKKQQLNFHRLSTVSAESLQEKKDEGHHIHIQLQNTNRFSREHADTDESAFTDGEFYRKPGLLVTFSLKRNNEKISTL